MKRGPLLGLKGVSPETVIEEEARRRYMTGVVLTLIGAVLFVVTVLMLVGWASGLFNFADFSTILFLDLFVLAGRWLLRRQNWRWASYIPPAMFFALGAYLNSLAGIFSNASILYALTILITAMLHGGRASWSMLALCLGSYLVMGGLFSGVSVDAFIPAAITFSFSLIGFTLLQWFFTDLLKYALLQAHAHGQHMEREVVERTQTQEALQAASKVAFEFQEKLTALHQISIELAKVESVEDLFRQSIVLGRERLGFDRLGVWIIRDGRMFGMFGTDVQGRLRDERHWSMPVTDDARIFQALQNNLRVTLWEDVDLLDNWKNVGRGWNVLAPLWNGDEATGWMAADNLLSRRPLRSYELDLLALYGATLGHLYTRKQAEETLRTNEARYRAVINGAPVTLFMLDREGVVTFMEGRNRLMGQEPETFLGKTLSAFHPNTPQSAEAIRRALRGEEISTLMEGDGLWQEVRLSPLWDSKGEISGVIGVLTDVTERKRAEEQQLQLALERGRVKILSDFMTYASHEFRSPLSVINANLYLLERLDSPEARRQRSLTAIEQTAYIERLIGTMLKMVRLEQGVDFNVTPLYLDSLLNDLVNGLKNRLEEKRLALALNLARDLPVIQGDTRQLHDALANLLDNAIAYTPEKGTITLEAFVRGEYAVIEISDTGAGIDGKDLPHIFEYFYRADEARTARRAGLGLPIAQKIIEAHGGRIEVESAPGRGSTFRVLLPIR